MRSRAERLFSLVLFIAERKEVLLVTGYLRDVGKQVAIVDKNGQPKQCTSVQNFPTAVDSAMGGLLNNQLVICGGTTTGDYRGATNKCQRLGNNGQWSPFGAGQKVARYWGASATVQIQGEDFLWITGVEDSSGHTMKSTELLSSSGSVIAGRDLPEARRSHCMLVINNHVLVIGGVSSSDIGRSVIIFDSSNDFSHEEGASMMYKRFDHACSTMVSFAHEGRTVAVVAGGDGQDTAEILDYTIPGSTWHLSEYL